MTNYERICDDKEFCASVIAPECHSLDGVLQWLDQEQVELTNETEATHDQSGL